MSNDASTRLGLPYLAAAQAQKHVTVNEALSRLDALVQLSVESRSLAAEPAAPSDGAVYILPAGASGADWAGAAAGGVAQFTAGGWSIIPPGTGWLAYVKDERRLLVFGAEGWGEAGLALGELENLARLGLGMVANAANPLAVKLNAALFQALAPSEGGAGDLRLMLDKSASANDAALVFETGFSARALVGLLESDDFTIKLSPDGASFYVGLVADHASGRVALPANPRFAATSNYDNYIAAGTPTKLGFNIADLNPQNAFNAASNSFTAPAAGYYRFSVSVLFKKNAALPTAAQVQLYKNGSAAGRGIASVASPQDGATSLNLAVALSLSAGDVVDARATFTGADGYIAAAGSSFCGEWLG